MHQEVLRKILDEARRPGAVVAFDLDSTLVDNRPRQALIMREFGAATGILELEGARPEHWSGWDIVKAMCNIGLAPDRAAALREQAIAFWWDRFFDGSYCRWDVPLPGAAKYVHSVMNVGAAVAYVTGRHERMRSGTLASLGEGGFPLPDGVGKRVHLLMKPAPRDNDDRWKADAQELLRGFGRVVAAFDNEPAHCNAYRQGWPEATVVHIRTDHSGRDIQLLPGIVSIDGYT